MAAYCDSDDIDARVPTSVQLQALDDDADGVADTDRLTSIRTDASRWVDALLRKPGGTELSTPYPPIAVQASIARSCWAIYERAGAGGDSNPYKAEMESYQKMLMDIGLGEGDLDATGGVNADVYDPEDDDNDPSVFVDPTGL